MVKIVLIDDDPISIFVTEKLIHKNVRMPCKIFSFDNALDALRDIKNIKPQYLFVDLNMPDMSGWDFLERFCPKNREPEIYILSSSIDQRDINRANQYDQVKKFLSKPLIKHYVNMIFGEERQA
ncbi:response regulator [Negadavirga shengliensis]|uniref:Response regulator n=1 Tax=Negadavirga shengliensis TaxID=1389218 RepID=A0ABV9T2J4_9BACT